MRKAKRVSKIYFFLPIVLIGGLILYSYFSIVIPKPKFGTIVIKAQVSSKYYQTKEIKVYATVLGKTILTPTNISVTPGIYNVSFQQINGLKTPNGCNLDVSEGETVYCVGEYSPIPAVINVYENSFQPSTVYAYTQITPVIWVNRSQNYTVLIINPIGREIIAPNGNFTYIFDNTGTYGFYYLFSSGHGEVVVQNLS